MSRRHGNVKDKRVMTKTGGNYLASFPAQLVRDAFLPSSDGRYYYHVVAEPGKIVLVQSGIQANTPMDKAKPSSFKPQATEYLGPRMAEEYAGLTFEQTLDKLNKMAEEEGQPDARNQG